MRIRVSDCDSRGRIACCRDALSFLWFMASAFKNSFGLAL